jgi:hypothetical protein
VHGREAGEGHGQVEAQGDVVAVVLEAVDLPVGLLPPLAEQDIGVLQPSAGVSMGAKP